MVKTDRPDPTARVVGAEGVTLGACCCHAGVTRFTGYMVSLLSEVQQEERCKNKGSLLGGQDDASNTEIVVVMSESQHEVENDG